MNTTENNSDKLVTTILKGIDKVKAEGITILDLRDVERAGCDYFIICTGNSNTQVKALHGSINKVVGKEAQEKPFKVEGEMLAEWILIDYVNVVVHVFQREAREFYNIEEAWSDAKITEIPNS